MTIPVQPKIYHIVHVDRLQSIIADNGLWCDADIIKRASLGTTIGMSSIKQRRLDLTLTSHPDLHVGECVPFYFCPRSIMLYIIHQANHPELSYQGGQEPIIHLQADLLKTVNWAEHNCRRWAFTLSNAGAYYFEDRADLEKLNEINWPAVKTKNWQHHKEGKQAEFLLEKYFPWHLVEFIGVYNEETYQQVNSALLLNEHHPTLQIEPSWYY